MWRYLWRSIDRFSLQYFKYVINELRDIRVVDEYNREVVVDLLQSIVEIVTYGDRHDPSIFECFMEYQVLAEFVRILKISRNSRIEAPLLQYLSIMIQNLNSEHAIYYCFSNEYINNIITHQYDFDGGDLMPYYISFLRAASCKLNRDTLCLLVKVQQDVVVSFPLYSEALKFSHHGEKMIQIAVRAISLNIYNVSDDMVCQFLTTPPASEYFSYLVSSLREKCLHLDDLVHVTKETCTSDRKKELIVETDKIVDDLYYFNDILSVGNSQLSRLVTDNLLTLFVFPILLQLLHLTDDNEKHLSPLTSLYLVSRLLQVIDGTEMVNSVGRIILYPNIACMASYSGPDSDRAENIKRNFSVDQFLEYVSSTSEFFCNVYENIPSERAGILSYIYSDNQSLLLASLFLLLVLAESADLDYLLASVIGLPPTKVGMHNTMADTDSVTLVVGESILLKHMPQILNALLSILASQPPLPLQWHTGWILRNLLVIQEKKLTHQDFDLFITSFDQSRERLWKELDGSWFDYIPETLQKEWRSCQTENMDNRNVWAKWRFLVLIASVLCHAVVLEESSHSKDPLFTLDHYFKQDTPNGHSDSFIAWQRMVDAVKVFVLHLQLRSLIFEGCSPESTIINLTTEDGFPANVGTELPLGSGIPCKISFSKAEMRDVHLLPVSKGISGKLLLVEKHPHRDQIGVVIAVEPLAGLNPKLDEIHPTWLHLRLREFDPRYAAVKTRGQHSRSSNRAVEGRWTLGFLNTNTCEAARSIIARESSKQRSSVERLITSLLGNSSNNQHY